MYDEPTIVRCFTLALEVNGERHGGVFERDLFETYLEAYPAYKAPLFEAVRQWLSLKDDIAMARMQSVYDRAT